MLNPAGQCGNIEIGSCRKALRGCIVSFTDVKKETMNTCLGRSMRMISFSSHTILFNFVGTAFCKVNGRCLRHIICTWILVALLSGSCEGGDDEGPNSEILHRMKNFQQSVCIKCAKTRTDCGCEMGETNPPFQLLRSYSRQASVLSKYGLPKLEFCLLLCLGPNMCGVLSTAEHSNVFVGSSLPFMWAWNMFE